MATPPKIDTRTLVLASSGQGFLQKKVPVRRQSVYLSGAFASILWGKVPTPYNISTRTYDIFLVVEVFLLFCYFSETEARVKCEKDCPSDLYAGSCGVQIGKKTSVGHYGNWKMPAFMTNFSRKNLFVENIGPLVDGKLSTWL
jgi:hypothetical protein